ncbi:MAG: ACT domain-containing protein [Lachnospiraceae bacterium]|nr:ACT domain-containing protein [Lachnospiraceae bacterium]
MSNRIIITVVGCDTVGIIAKVCTYLAENNINIMDISQTVVQDIFNMMMIVDTVRSEKKFADIADEMERLGKEELGVEIRCQREEIFHQMHRI